MYDVPFSCGKVKFMKDYQLQAKDNWKFRGVPNVGDLIATRTPPTGWTDEGALDHYLKVSWDNYSSAVNGVPTIDLNKTVTVDYAPTK